MLEHLRAIHPELAEFAQQNGDILLCIGYLEEHVTGMCRDSSPLPPDFAITHRRLDGIETRIGGIEKRLELGIS